MAEHIPKAFIDELVSRTDIVDLIDSYVPLKKAGRDYAACCPFHNEKTPSFTVSRNKQFFHCFGCGAHGTALGFLMDYQRMDFVDAVRELARQAGIDVPTTGGPGHKGPDREPVYRVLADAAAFFREQLPRTPAAVDYLKSRGLTGEVATRFGLGYAPKAWDKLLGHFGTDRDKSVLLEAGLAIQREGGGLYDRFRDRIMFPIVDRRGRVVGFGGRILEEGTPKYLNSPETPVFHKGREVYGLFQAREANRNLSRLVIVEGYMDVVGLAQFGVSDSVATLGTATTPEQVTLLFRSTPLLVFCFDGDAAGRRAAERALEVCLPLLHEGREVRFAFLPEGQDPDSMVRSHGVDGFRALLDDAQPLAEFLVANLSREVNLATLDGRARFVTLAKKPMSQIPAGPLRQLLLQELGLRSHMAAQDLARLLETRDRQARRPRARVRSPRSHGPSLMRRTISLLLHHPQVMSEVAVPGGLERLNLPGADVLRGILDLLGHHPNVSMGNILEHYRDTETGRHLNTLAMQGEAWDEELDPAAELRDGLQRLVAQGSLERLNALREKAMRSALSEEEKREYLMLCAQRDGKAEAASQDG